jgi:predicted DNA-binding transcriptional regulator AlpA
MMSDRIIRKPEGQLKIGTTLSGFNRLQQRDPNFPKPIKLGERAVGYSEREMDEYVKRVIENRSVTF